MDRLLADLGFLKPSPTRSDLDRAQADVRAVLDYPHIPLRWVNAGLELTAGRYKALNELAENYRILATSVRSYTSGASSDADPSVARVAVDACTRLRVRLPSLPKNARGQALYLEEVESQLQSLVGAANDLGDALREFQVALALPEEFAANSRAAADVAKLAASIAESGRAEPQWFDVTEQDRLQNVAVTAGHSASSAAAIRSGLESKFHHAAFTPPSRPHIDEVLRHRRWWTRLGGSWRRARLSFNNLYSTPAQRRPREVLDDAFGLAQFQDHLSSIDERVGRDRAALQWDGRDDYSWGSVEARLRAIRHAPSQLQQSEAFQAAMCSPDSATRDVTARAGRRSVQAFERVMSAAARVADAAKAPDVFGQADPGVLTLADLRGRAAEIHGACAEQLGNLRALLPVIGLGSDVGMDSLVGDFMVLADMRAQWDRAAKLAADLGEVLPGSQLRSLGDWTEQARLAEWVTWFLRKYADGPPQHLVRAISDESVRAELSACLGKMKLANDPDLKSNLDFVESLFSPSEDVSTGITLGLAPVAAAVQWLTERAKDSERVAEWVDFTKALREMERVGLRTLGDEIVGGLVSADEGLTTLHERFYRLWLDAAYRAEPALSDFDLERQDQTLARFRKADRFFATNGAAQIRAQISPGSPSGNLSQGGAPHGSELQILLGEINKKRRHLPLRRLFASMPSLLLRLKPCVMMSPLSVSTFLDSEHIRFDVVVFDEASQIRPHDAICAIYRGKQLVVAGDQKQLPPTAFFERLGDDEDTESDDTLRMDSSDYESILDVCATLGLPRRRLKWHYRSKRELLIAFSNQHFYNGELITFPSACGADEGVVLQFVENARWAKGGVNQVEAESIARAVIDHAGKYPKKSLGVITLNQAQQMCVLDILDALRRRASLDLGAFFTADSREPFFVKNLENVQGDERDVVFLGVGYAPNEGGRLSHNFGPLNREGGERRLNVAVTRARESLTVFSSIRARDIDLSRTQSRGASLLRAYLDFAEQGKTALAAVVTKDSQHGFDSDFEAQVARALKDRGLNVHSQVGCSGFRIDLALVHPDYPGQYVLGVECDGATYHRAATARDRDRLRQEVLEGLGWTICRIWSTDWVSNPNRQIEKVLDAYREALATSNRPPQPAEEAHADQPLSRPNRPMRPRPPVWDQRSRHDKAGGQRPPKFSSIHEVPSDLIRDIIIEALKKFGATPAEALAPTVAREMGFQRTGRQICERVDNEVRALKQQALVNEDINGRVRLSM